MLRAVSSLGRFPRVFWVSLGLELLERLAFYGVYVNLAVYLTETVKISDAENGLLLGVFALVRSWVPVVTGAAADRIGFRRSLVIAFSLYIGAYILLFAAPSRPGAWAAMMGMALAGAFLKPVIPGTVRRYAPDDQRAVGFSLFYASVNAGSVIGKVLTKIVRTTISLRASMINAVVACAIGLVVTLTAFREPTSEALDRIDPLRPGGESVGAPPPAAIEASSPVDDLARLLRQGQLLVFLALISGYYLLIEQFYQTFPIYITRTFGENAPREYITLINPAAIAIFQVLIGRISQRIPALAAMSLGVFLGSASMLLMGVVPSLSGACLSFLVFAFAEMVFAPRYFEYISSFAPRGREGLYMGLSIVPLGIGGLVGGVLSGKLISSYLPKEGPRSPVTVWATYAAIGVVCAFTIAIFGAVVRKRPRPSVP